ncbi:hypothetical protein BELL_0096g00010 [Botrytis elliptica]|uniref:Uncharacterized protein n=1 Tax=Botrytis elliptica TaxID=278938 RepID=A0A4Z1JUX7_9HELO|nr:hypothetical protein EAE99_002516 [Botrytis elliptica]TGO77651.1 hypothetical protein BELL_0096g00010 [Botrytis elliptica]
MSAVTALKKLNIWIYHAIRLQQNAKHPDTMGGNTISLRHEDYVTMIESWKLPLRAIECSNALSVLFWSSVEDIGGNPHLQIIFRKGDVRKKGITRGWELILSHEIKAGITRGFCKGTATTEIVESLQALRACISDTSHPMLLPFLILSEKISYGTELKQKRTRDWLRMLEQAVADHTGHSRTPVTGQTLSLDLISININRCYAETLWASPLAYIRLIEYFLETMNLFKQYIPLTGLKQFKLMETHDKLIPALKLYKLKQQGVETYANTTLKRLENERSLSTIVLAQRDSKLQYDMGKLQYEMALASKRDSSAMKTIAILGILFLPGTFVASILSTTFFDFQNASSLRAAVSPSFWIYWVITVPVTLIILVFWYLWERKRDGRFVKERNEREKTEDLALEIDLEEYNSQPLQRARPLAVYE